MKLRLESGATKCGWYSNVDEGAIDRTRAEVYVGMHNRSLVKGWAAHGHKMHRSALTPQWV